jgi:hypothetical protein
MFLKYSLHACNLAYCENELILYVKETVRIGSVVEENISVGRLIALLWLCLTDKKQDTTLNKNSY